MTPPPLGSGPPEADVYRLKDGRPPLGGTHSGYGPRGGGVIPPPLCVPHSGATKEVGG